ncbi:MAG TPA: hypothetical protein VI612_01900 [Candidatus Nanoarchaeia archaeon]|nr:hypothetical protein [Candidatus Nanoarchaeia archaeon]
MKKSVEVTLLIAILGVIVFFTQGAQTLTGLQAIDVSQLPAPPSPPGMMDVTVPTTPAPAASLPPTPPPPAVVPAVEEPVPVTKPTYIGVPSSDQFSALQARIDSLQSTVDGFSVTAENMRQFMSRPVVEQPAFFESLNSLKGTVRNNAILSISLSVFVLLLVIGLIANGVVQKKRTDEENKMLLVQYLANYTKAGYNIETLRMHLRACGWHDDMIQGAVQELRKR